jgi:parallel beta-helix repeat protein
MKRLLSIGVILLFIGMSISSTTGVNLEKQSSTTLNGKTLYVGGSGPGNYTKIQDAIDNASDGDTVFVYNGTYYERIEVDKSLNLIGEDRNITIIDSGGGVNILLIRSWVYISGFTIQNGTSGILIRSNYNTITGNTITKEGSGIWFTTLPHRNNNISGNNICDNSEGICLWVDDNNTISSNKILNNTFHGIGLAYSGNNEISKNSISGSDVGISQLYSINNIINGNTIKNNNLGIEVYETDRNLISGNNIVKNQLGIKLEWSCNKVIKNNFIENKQNVYYHCYFNRWIRNYWDDWRGLNIKWAKFFPFLYPYRINEQRFQFDWFPASEPYNIEV